MKLHQKLFFLLVFLLPAQLARHFWPDFSFVFGIRVDYLAPTIYLTDILVFLIIVTWLPGFIVKNVKNLTRKQWSNVTIFILAFLYLLLTSLSVAQNQGAALYKLAKLVELSLFGFYVFKNGKLVIGNWKFSSALSLAVIYSSFIAWGQLILGRSIAGPFWWLGERTFDAATPGIALAQIGGSAMLRPYSIFSHPNSLAGFLLVSLILIAGFRQNKLSKTALILGTSAILISFSQTAWIVAAVIFLIFLAKLKNFQVLTKLILGLVLTGSLIQPFLPKFVEVSREFTFRQELAQASGKMISRSPLFGVGLNNFIVRLPEFSQTPSVSWSLQPVHNIFLLVFAETGILGLGFFVWFLWLVVKKERNLKLVISILAVLLTGLADHYWLTLQQNQLLFTLVVALAAARRGS